MDSGEEDILRRTQVKSSLAQILDKIRLEAVVGPVFEQFGDDLRALTDAEQDSKELKSAKRHLLFERIEETVEPRVPGRSRDRRRRRAAGQGRPHAPVRQARGRVDLQGDRAPQDRGREEPARRSRPGGDPPDRVRGGRQPAHARLGALPAWPDADHVAADARHREGGSAHRRPLPRGGASVHAPLQLPAVLGRGDGVHARPEAPRHRPRRARAAGARAGDPDPGRVPVHDPHRLGDARVERLVVDGLGLRLDARRSTTQACRSSLRSRASRWASSRKATTT